MTKVLTKVLKALKTERIDLLNIANQFTRKKDLKLIEAKRKVEIHRIALTMKMIKIKIDIIIQNQTTSVDTTEVMIPVIIQIMQPQKEDL